MYKNYSKPKSCILSRKRVYMTLPPKSWIESFKTWRFTIISKKSWTNKNLNIDQKRANRQIPEITEYHVLFGQILPRVFEQGMQPTKNWWSHTYSLWGPSSPQGLKKKSNNQPDSRSVCSMWFKHSKIRFLFFLEDVTDALWKVRDVSLKIQDCGLGFNTIESNS